MIIVPYSHFRHAASLKGFHGTQDPRQEVFGEANVDLDLRKCEFVRVPAVLWCLIYALLAQRRGSSCRLWSLRTWESASI